MKIKPLVDGSLVFLTVLLLYCQYKKSILEFLRVPESQDGGTLGPVQIGENFDPAEETFLLLSYKGCLNNTFTFTLVGTVPFLLPQLVKYP